MAIKIYEQFAPFANPADGDHPYGSFKNDSIPGAEDGTPLDAVWGNDLVGFTDALLAQAGIVPSGQPDTVGNSQRVDAIKQLEKAASRVTKNGGGSVQDFIDQFFDNVEQMLSYSNHILGTKYSTGGTTWDVVTITTPMTLNCFEPIGVVHVDDFDGGLSHALDNARRGWTLVLSARDYNIAGKYRLDTIPESEGGVFIGNEISDITIVGAGMPEYSDDDSRLVSGSGTVIQGALINFADGFKCYNLGVDVGSHVVDTFNAGVYMEGFIPCTHKINTRWYDSALQYKNNIDFANIRVLAKYPTSVPATMKHCCLFEYVDGGLHGYLETRGGYFGFALKSRNISAYGDVVTSGAKAYSVIFKTDEWAEVGNYSGQTITTGRRDGIRSAGIGVRAHNSTRLKGISFNWRGRNCKGIDKSGTGFTTRLEDVSIGFVDVDDCDTTAVTFPETADRWVVGQHTIVNAPYGFFTSPLSRQCHVGSGSFDTGISGYVLDSDVSHGELSVKRCTTFGVDNRGAVIAPDRISGTLNTSGLISGLLNVTQAMPLVNGWVAGGVPFKAEASSSGIRISGEVKSGTSDIIVTGGTFSPVRAMTIPVAVYTGSAWSVLPCVISGGQIIVVGARLLSSGSFISFGQIEFSIKV